MLNETEKKEYQQLRRECLTKDDAVRENAEPAKLAKLKQLAEKAKLPAEEKGSAPPPKETGNEKGPIILSKIKLDAIGKLSLPELRAICKEEHLPSDADADVLVKIVRAKKLGGDKQVLRENTLCKYCKYPASIIGSEVKTIFQDKSRVVRYRLKCSGPRTHKFTFAQSENFNKNSKK
jgi:hypothetical protein